MDVAMCLVLLRHDMMLKSSKMESLDRAVSFGEAASATRGQLALLYLAAGMWKLNSSFLHPGYSCASVFAAQLADKYWPESLLAESSVIYLDTVATAAVAVAPTATVMVELAIGILLAVPRTRRVGIVLALLLHLGIVLTPPPNGATNFAVGCAVRMFLFMPEAATCKFASD
jgi:hypothetical protein